MSRYPPEKPGRGTGLVANDLTMQQLVLGYWVLIDASRIMSSCEMFEYQIGIETFFSVFPIYSKTVDKSESDKNCVLSPTFTIKSIC